MDFVESNFLHLMLAIWIYCAILYGLYSVAHKALNGELDIGHENKSKVFLLFFKKAITFPFSYIKDFFSGNLK